MIDFLGWLVSDNRDEIIRISHIILDFEVCHEMPASARLLPAFLSAVVCANPDSPEIAETVLRPPSSGLRFALSFSTKSVSAHPIVPRSSRRFCYRRFELFIRMFLFRLGCIKRNG
jgi:hypothetical protein